MKRTVFATAAAGIFLLLMTVGAQTASADEMHFNPTHVNRGVEHLGSLLSTASFEHEDAAHELAESSRWDTDDDSGHYLADSSRRHEDTDGSPRPSVPSSVPDGGMTFMLLGGAMIGLEPLRRKLIP